MLMFQYITISSWFSCEWCCSLANGVCEQNRRSLVYWMNSKFIMLHSANSDIFLWTVMTSFISTLESNYHFWENCRTNYVKNLHSLWELKDVILRVTANISRYELCYLTRNIFSRCEAWLQGRGQHFEPLLWKTVSQTTGQIWTLREAFMWWRFCDNFFTETRD
jgi:hypothetical protein